MTVRATGTDPAHDIRPLVRRLRKLPRDWRRADLRNLVLEDGIRIINLRYPGFDGKLRELRVPVTDPEQLERLLAVGERVDGSSLFPGLFGSTSSDLYVVPVYRWAFLHPWADDELDIVCRYAARDGAPCERTPDNLLIALSRELESSTGLSLRGLAELEFYLILDRVSERFAGKAQRNYHQALPYLHGREIADEILRVVSAVTGCVKYCHAEVGYMDRVPSEDPELAGRRAVQFELEQSLVPMEDLGTWLTVARWLIRTVASRHGASATFLPKLEPGTAGSGLHLHLALERDGRNVMRNSDGALSDEAIALIGGLLGEAPALAAFGNTVAASYLRLVPGQEAPTHVCWGRNNRSSLVRIPLDFATEHRVDRVMNPDETEAAPPVDSQATVEFRSPDGSAFPHLLLAAVTACVAEGVSRPDGRRRALSLELPVAADRPLDTLPGSAAEAAERLRDRRAFFESRGFPSAWIDLVIEKLVEENDRDLAARLGGLAAEQRAVELRRILHKDLHKH